MESPNIGCIIVLPKIRSIALVLPNLIALCLCQAYFHLQEIANIKQKRSMRTRTAIRAISNSSLLQRYRRIRIICVLPICFVAVVILVLLQRPISTESVDSNPSPMTSFPLDLWKQPILLNLSFSWISNNENLCHQDPNVSEHRHILPILIHSYRFHLANRLAIRKTWGSIRTYKKWDIRLIFLLGQVDPVTSVLSKEQFQYDEKRLREEQTAFQDIVIGSFIDSYRNMSFKHLMGYKWILNFCREAQFIWKVDDDVFFDTLHWLDWHSNELEKASKNENYTMPDLLCNPSMQLHPARKIPGQYVRWGVSYQEWPGPIYPNYCSGLAHSIQLDFMEKVYAVSNSRKMLWIDDVYVTGVLREVAEETFNITPQIRSIRDEEATYDIGNFNPVCKNRTFQFTREFKSVTEIRSHIPLHMMCYWNKTLYDRGKLYGKSYLEGVTYQRLTKGIRLDTFYDY